MSNDFKSVKDFLAKFDKKEEKKKSQKNQKNTKDLKLFSFIESGKFKGKKLRLPSLETTRSTKSIVKACVFNVLRTNLRDKIFIEAFGGSALMAAEALSNNALKAYAIEFDKKAYEIAAQNAKIIDENLIVLHGDTFKILPTFVEKIEQEFVLYFDPPFSIREGFCDIYERVYALIENLNTTHLVQFIIEHHSYITTPQNLCNFTRVKLKKFGATSLSFYEKLDKTF
ncbi:RsmD family RNA methyltransferase [Campylobacter sp. CCS1377]|uniref:RsmD family RNA methyltransferase n=1 Tax=Campylobacter sp. CCS1377 TaxID=3158229 RepID=A0AAU7E681_9BACT